MRGRILLLGFAFGCLAAFGQAPNVLNGGIINAAGVTGGQPVAPGSLISIFGTSLAAAQALADSVPLSTVLSDATVTINGITAPLTFVSAGQINAQLPWEVQPGTATVVVSRPTGDSQPQTVQVAPSAPSIFFFPNADGRLLGIAQNSDDFLLAWAQNTLPGTNTEPVKRGQALIIYATGLGAVDPPVTTGNSGGSVLHTALGQLSVLVGGAPAQMLFAGMSPQFVGVNQINIVVPQNAPTGANVPLQISMDGVLTSDKVLIAVQ